MHWSQLIVLIRVSQTCTLQHSHVRAQLHLDATQISNVDTVLLETEREKKTFPFVVLFCTFKTVLLSRTGKKSKEKNSTDGRTQCLLQRSFREKFPVRVSRKHFQKKSVKVSSTSPQKVSNIHFWKDVQKSFQSHQSTSAHYLESTSFALFKTTLENKNVPKSNTEDLTDSLFCTVC